jgi:hypothetical protein
LQPAVFDNQPMQMTGFNQAGFTRRIQSIAKTVNQIFNDPLVSDNQNGVAGPFPGGIYQGVMASLPHNDAVFSSRRAKLPAESLVFIELIKFFILNFFGRFSRPLAP